MLLAVVSLKCSRPKVTLVILPLGRLTLQEQQPSTGCPPLPGCFAPGPGHVTGGRGRLPPGTYLTGWKGLLLRSGWDCSMVTWRLGESIWEDRELQGRPGRASLGRRPPAGLRSHLDPKDFEQEVVDLLRTSRRADVSRLRGHADVDGDLEVVLLLTHEGLVAAGVDEALVRVHVVGGGRPGGGEEEEEDTSAGSALGLHGNKEAWLCVCTHSVWKPALKTVHHRSGLYCSHVRCWFGPALDPAPPTFPKPPWWPPSPSPSPSPSASGPSAASSSDLLLFFLSAELQQRKRRRQRVSAPPGAFLDPPRSRTRLKICLPGGERGGGA